MDPSEHYELLTLNPDDLKNPTTSSRNVSSPFCVLNPETIYQACPVVHSHVPSVVGSLFFCSQELLLFKGNMEVSLVSNAISCRWSS